MINDVASQLKSMTGFVPEIRNVQIVTSLSEWKRANLSVAVMEDGDRCGVFVHCNEPDSLTEQQVRANITRVLSDDYFVQAENGTLVISSLQIEVKDDPATGTDDDRSESRDDGGDSGGIDGD